MKSKVEKSDQIAGYLGAILVVSMCLVFVFSFTNLNPYSFIGKIHQVLNHPFVMVILLLILVISVFGSLNEYTRRKRLDRTGKETIETNSTAIKNNHIRFIESQLRNYTIWNKGFFLNNRNWLFPAETSRILWFIKPILSLIWILMSHISNSIAHGELIWVFFS